MDGESEPSPVVAEDAEEKAELLDATPSSQPPSPPPAEESGEPVSMETGDEATKEGGTEDNDDDDVVLVEEEASQPLPAAAATSSPDGPDAESAEHAGAAAEDAAETPSKSPDCPPSSNASMAAATAAAQKPRTAAPEPIVIDDEEDCEQKENSSPSPALPGESSASHSPAALSSNDPDSEIRISSVTTLGSSNQRGSAANTPPHPDDAQADINLLITSVTSLQGGAAAVGEVRISIGSAGGDEAVLLGGERLGQRVEAL